MQGYPTNKGALPGPPDSSIRNPQPPVKRPLSTSQQASAQVARSSSAKVPRVDPYASAAPSSFSASRRTVERESNPNLPRSGRGRGLGHHPGPSSSHTFRGGALLARRAAKLPKKPLLNGPFHNEDLITQLHSKSSTPLQSKHTSVPKSSLSNFCTAALGVQPQYASHDGIFDHGTHRSVIWRTTITVGGLSPPIIATGDAPDKKESERLAALGALYQLHSLDLLNNAKKLRRDTRPDKATVQLSDGSVVNYERARGFIDYYCRRYKFGREDVSFRELSGSGPNKWEAVMTVNLSRIGVGTAPAKKEAQVQCYLDVTQYLEKCDPELWKAYVEASKTGADLGLAPRVRFQISGTLDDRIQTLCSDVRLSSLYRNRPARTTSGRPTVPQLPLPSSTSSSLSSVFLEDKSKTLSALREQYMADPRMQKMRATRMSLPVYTRSDAILDHVRENDVTICTAATGSGKTTQIPQMILDDYIQRGKGAECNIICTQPRRLAAISVASRVASERDENLGASIGYQVRFENKLPENHGSVTFCTTGIFLKRLQSALSGSDEQSRRKMDQITHIIVDEVHERDVDTDLLLVVLKRLMADRRARNIPLKIVLMSATVDPRLFQSYFKDEAGAPCKVIDIPGRAYPVEKRFMDDFLPALASGPTRWIFNDESVANYVHKEVGPAAASRFGIRLAKPPAETDVDLDLPYPLIAATISHALQISQDGHILVFLPGWDEIMATMRALEQPLGLLPVDFNDKSKYTIHLLHSTIPLAEQQVIFEPPPPGVRRIILATNIAETSVTIPDVVYVVDTAKIKEIRYEPEKHMSSLVSTWVGSSNLNQRAGRAGRHRPGIYYGILSKSHVESLHPHQAVEMKRVDLTNVVMHVKALNFSGMSVQEVLAATIEPPESTRVTAALKDLSMVGALDADENLTPLGRVLLGLPVEVQMGRLVLYGSFFRCLDQALTLAAILTNRDPFVSPMHLKKEADAVKNSWAPEGFRSDPLATLRAFNEWWSMQSRGDYTAANRFCFDNFLAKPTLLLIQKVKQQLYQALDHAGVLDVSSGTRTRPSSSRFTVPPELNVNGDCWPLLAGLISVACQPKFAIRTGNMILRTATDKVTFIHPSSVNNRKKGPKAKLLASDEPPEEKQIYAYAEKRRNASQGGTPQTFLVNTTRLDPLVYLLFGAYNAQVVERGLECDNWLPVVGDVDTLDDIVRLKTYMESCFLRVYEGIVAGRSRTRRNTTFGPREEESEDEYEETFNNKKGYSLSSQEIKELDRTTQDIVGILSMYSQERMESQSRSNSRPATPGPTEPSERNIWSSRSGYSTPNRYFSRPATPSNLSRR